MTTSQINYQIENLAQSIFIEVNSGESGATFNFDGQKVNFEKGYMVSRKSPSLILSYSQFEKLTLDSLGELLKKLYFKASKFDYLGYWFDDQKIYIDLSINIENKSQAIQFGLANDQKAIWDCKNEITINLQKYSF